MGAPHLATFRIGDDCKWPYLTRAGVCKSTEVPPNATNLGRRFTHPRHPIHGEDPLLAHGPKSRVPQSFSVRYLKAKPSRQNRGPARRRPVAALGISVSRARDLYFRHVFCVFTRPRPPPPARAMDPPLLDHIICPRCSTELDVTDSFCRHCGAPTAVDPDVPAAPPPDQRVPNQSIQDNPWAMIGLLFLAMGPLALPMLWRGRAFGRRGKIVLTLLTALQTVAVVFICYYTVVELIIKPLQKVFP